MAVAIIFLSYIFLTIFGFLIVDVKVISASILNWLYISNFIFLFIKIVMQR